jgi:phosphoglycolate phosphatase/beta-phosphoglucomutase
MIKAVFFDFNGVIIDDEALHEKAFREVLQTEGIEISEEDYLSALGADDRNFVRLMFERKGKDLSDEVSRSVIERKTEIYRSYIAKDIPLFPGIENFIKTCAQQFHLAVVSMARRAEIEYVLERADLLEYFPIIVTADEVSVCKPDPTCYKVAFRQMDRFRLAEGRNPLVQKGCLVIEDSPPGTMAGKAAGMNVLGVTNTVSAEKLREAGADSVTKNLADWTPSAINRVF